MIKRLITLIIAFMGLFYIYDHDYYGSKQFVRDVKKEVYLPATNAYVKTNVTNSFVKITNDFVPDNRQELLNIYYTVVNSGWDDFTFYCNYDQCLSDVNSISNDAILLSNLNSFVSPYNQYNTISTYTTPLLNSKVNITVTKAYNSLDINKISEQVDKIYTDLKVDSYSNDRDKIRVVHDYLINNTKYDARKITNINDTTYHSNTAYGLIFEGYAVCSGYADTMSLFLDKMGIHNMRVASATHVWNLVYLNNGWYHLDLTWDDPYSAEGKNMLSHYFFLIDYDTLKDWDTTEHNFDTNIYKEALFIEK